MKKYLIICLLMVAGIYSCDYDELVYDNVNGQTLIQFDTQSVVLPTPAEGASAQVDVLVSTISTGDRTISVSADVSSTATPDQYSISNLVIPANSYVGTITISSNFDALPESGSSMLVLNLDGLDNIETSIDKGTLNVEFFRKCPIVLEELVGDWSGTGSWSEVFGYTTEIVTAIDGDGDLTMNGIAFQWFTGWWGEVIVTNSAVKVDIDLETGEFVIEDQFYITATFNGAPQPTYNLRATGRILNACEKTLEIFPVFNQEGSVFDGTGFGGPPFLETIQLDN